MVVGELMWWIVNYGPIQYTVYGRIDETVCIRESCLMLYR